MILAGVLLKMGTFGLLKFCLPFFPNAAQDYAILFGILAVIGIIYGALVARVQPDAKKLVAYSSVSHLGFVVLGLFAFTPLAMQGALIQMVNHGISTGALFLIVGMLYERRHTRLMEDYGGIAKVVPLLTFFMVFSVLASAGLPGLNGFVGEFMILLGSFESDVLAAPFLIALATLGVILAAVYLLWMLYRMFFGPIRTEANRGMKDLNLREVALLVPARGLDVRAGLRAEPVFGEERRGDDVPPRRDRGEAGAGAGGRRLRDGHALGAGKRGRTNPDVRVARDSARPYYGLGICAGVMRGAARNPTDPPTPPAHAAAP